MNEIITWSDSYSLGIAEIDTQHKKLITLIGKLFSIVHDSKKDADIKEIIGELDEYAKYHLSTEEKYFEQFNYENKEEHIKSHDMYRNKVSQFLEEYYKDGDKTKLSSEALEFLKDWWIGHILGEDRMYVKCFHEHGL